MPKPSIQDKKTSLMGRPKGVRNKATLNRELVKKHFDQRVLRMQDKLLNAQTSLAVGQQFLFKIEKTFVKTGETKSGDDKGYWKNLPPKLVTEQWEIEDYLSRLAENNGSVDDQNDETATYYFLTTKEPNNNALDSMLDRVHGKAKQSVEVSGEVKFSLKQLAERRKELDKKQVIEVEGRVVEHVAEIVAPK